MKDSNISYEHLVHLLLLLQLSKEVNVFLDENRIMDDDIAVRDNRLALLQQVHKLFLQFADFSKLS